MFARLVDSHPAPLYGEHEHEGRNRDRRTGKETHHDGVSPLIVDVELRNVVCSNVPKENQDQKGYGQDEEFKGAAQEPARPAWGVCELTLSLHLQARSTQVYYLLVG